MSETKDVKFDNVHIFFGRLDTGKTFEIRKAVKHLLLAQPELSYAILGTERAKEYHFDEEWCERKPLSLKIGNNTFEVSTDADIIIIPDMRHFLDAAFLSAAAQTGKQVFVELYSNHAQKPLDRIKRWNNEFKYSVDSKDDPNFLKPLLAYYTKETPVVLEELSDEDMDKIRPIELFDPEESYNFHECEFDLYDDQAFTITKPVIKHLNFDTANFDATGITSIYGGNPNNFMNILKELLFKLFEEGVYSSYAVFPETNMYKEAFILETDRPMMPVNAHFNDKDLVTADTEADVIVIPLVNTQTKMDFLKVALLTGKPVIIAVDASNTSNVKALLSFLEESVNMINGVRDALQQYTHHDILATSSIALETPKAADQIVNYVLCSLPDEHNVITATWN